MKNIGKKEVKYLTLDEVLLYVIWVVLLLQLSVSV